MEMRMPAIERVTDAAGMTADRYVTRDGLALGLMHWDAEKPQAIIVGLHGMNDYSNAFAMPAPFWRQAGISTYAYDQRGFGRSPNRGIWGGADIMRRDLSDFVDVMRARFPGTPVYVMGESMGGAVAMSAFASDNPPRADGVILVAPAVWSRETMPFFYGLALWTTAHTFRWWSFTGSGLKITPSDNIEMLRALSRDPLVIKGTRTDTIYGLVSLMDEAYGSPRKLAKPPILFMYGDNDQIIPRAPTRNVLKDLGANVTVKEYPKGYHMLLRDLDGKTRWADVAAWIAAQNRKMQGPAMAAAE
jgi:alpha-beta hydrolase superfamily lysophospholipase